MYLNILSDQLEYLSGFEVPEKKIKEFLIKKSLENIYAETQEMRLLP